MVTFRSRRLEAVFGSPLDSLTYAHVADLVTYQVREAQDLDFKQAHYGPKDSDKRDLAGDVAALANTVGGVLVLGVAEDDQARASAAPGVEITDDHVCRIRHVVADLVAPFPAMDVRQVEDPNRSGHGFMLIAVPRSPNAPHAVTIGASLRFPRRNGTTTNYLTESDVAAAYRQRFAGFQNRFEDVAQYERDLTGRLAGAQQTFAVVSLAPDLAGDFTIDTKAVNRFRQEVFGKSPLVLPLGLAWQRTMVGGRRLVADGSADGPSRWLACELHNNGGGSFAAIVADPHDHSDGPDQTVRINDEYLVNAVWSGLRFLSRHARDRAAAAGNATVRVTLWPIDQERPALLTHRRQWVTVEPLSRQTVVTPPVATGVFDIEDLAQDGQPLVAAVSTLTSDLVQHFGVPEVLQLGPAGEIRTPYWTADAASHLRKWAAEIGVTLSDETLAPG